MSERTRQEIIARCDVAIKYLREGFSVVPLKRGTKEPLIPWKPLQKEPMNEDEAYILWVYDFPGADIGVIAGKVSNLCVLDIDDVEAFKGFLAHREIPKTPIVITRRGFHMWFRLPENLPEDIALRNCTLRPGIEFKVNACVPAPPSLHPSGIVRQWAKGYSIEDVKPAPPPDWLWEEYLRCLRQRPHTVSPPADLERELDGEGEQIPAEMAKRLLVSLARHLRRKGLSEELIVEICRIFPAGRCKPPLDEKALLHRVKASIHNVAPIPEKPFPEKIGEGARNNSLTSLAGSLRLWGATRDEIYKCLQIFNERACDPPLPEKEVLAIANSVSRYAPAPPIEIHPPASNGKGEGEVSKETKKMADRAADYVIAKARLFRDKSGDEDGGRRLGPGGRVPLAIGADDGVGQVSDFGSLRIPVSRVDTDTQSPRYPGQAPPLPPKRRYQLPPLLSRQMAAVWLLVWWPGTACRRRRYAALAGYQF